MHGDIDRVVRDKAVIEAVAGGDRPTVVEAQITVFDGAVGREADIAGIDAPRDKATGGGDVAGIADGRGAAIVEQLHDAFAYQARTNRNAAGIVHQGIDV